VTCPAQDVRLKALTPRVVILEIWVNAVNLVQQAQSKPLDVVVAKFQATSLPVELREAEWTVCETKWNGVGGGRVQGS